HFYPVLGQLDSEHLDLTLRSLSPLRFKTGEHLWTEEDKMQAFPFIIEGMGRVYKLSPNGRELHLYSVGPGDTCVLASGSLVNNSTLNARALCEKDYELATLPMEIFKNLVATSEVFRDYVLGDLSDHLTQLTDMVTAIVFQNLDQRLANVLVSKRNPIFTTHQTLADELGSVREIVSRLLKNFASRGWIELSRGQIKVLNPQDLIDFADQQ
ncbi:MAG: Crp/Fnr family transcriptional regulator, partial [Bdellovibrionales bacterium]|nr:Crp/Fnr family transcriptional regulator [Bdellovibrionales bacterium]